MKNWVKVLFFLAITPLGLMSQAGSYKGLSIGVRAVHLYDLPSQRHDNELSQDLWGLNGTNTNLDAGVDAYLEKQFTPLFGIQGGFRLGELSGANEMEYYNSNFYTIYADFITLLSNLDAHRIESSFNYYARLGLGRGKYDASRYMRADNSSNGGRSQSYWEGRVGAGVQYKLNSYLRIELDASYNLAYDDGFDGYKHSGGSDPYFATGLGVAYTFGSKEKRPLYTINYFDPDYSHRIAATDIPQLESSVEIKFQALILELEERLAENDSLVKYQNEVLEQLSALIGDHSRLIADHDSILKDQTRTISEIEAAIISRQQKEIREQLAQELFSSPEYMATQEILEQPKEQTSAGDKSGESLIEEILAEGELVASSINLPGALSEEVEELTSYFGFDSAEISEDFKQYLRNAYSDGSGEIKLVAYADAIGADNYNDRLKRRRAEAIRSFMIRELLCDPERIKIKIAEKQPDLGEKNYLNRKVVVQF